MDELKIEIWFNFIYLKNVKLIEIETNKIKKLDLKKKHFLKVDFEFS